MHAVLQRVKSSSVEVGGEVVGRVGLGVLLLIGVERGDTERDADAVARKVAALRIFPGRTPMDLTLAQVGGACLVVSQFTLAATVRKGNRPGFDRAQAPELAQPLYERVVSRLRDSGLVVETGRFGERMAVRLVNDGPLTLLLRARGGVLVE